MADVFGGSNATRNVRVMTLEMKIHKYRVRKMYLEVLKQEERCDWSFRRLNDSKKATADAFSGYKLKSKVCLLTNR